MKKLLFLLIPVFICLNNSFAQGPDWFWAKSAGGAELDQCQSIATDQAGNSYITGYFTSPSIVFGNVTLVNSFPGTYDIFIVKYDFTGHVLWAKSYGGTGTDYGQSIFADQQGHIYITGAFTSSSINVGGNILINSSQFASTDMFIIKLDTAANVIWTKNFSGLKGDDGTAIVADEQGNCYVTGRFQSDSLIVGNIILYNAGNFDIFLIKMDSSGHEVWASNASGNDYEIAYGLAINSRGELFQAGNFKSNFITFGNTTLINPDFAFSSDIFITKYDTAGSVLWTHNYGGSHDELCYSVAADPFGNCFITGEFNSDTVTFDGFTLINGGDWADVCVVKIDSSGNVSWAKRAGGHTVDFGKGIISDKNGNCFVTGCYRSDSISFDNEILTCAGCSDIFVVSYDGSGNVLMAKRIGNPDNDYPVGIAVDSIGNSYISGLFSGNSISIGNTNLLNTNPTTLDFFIAKMSLVSTLVNELNATEEGISAYPNPALQSLTIDCRAIGGSLKAFSIYNILGERVFLGLSTYSSQYPIEIDISKFPRGIYLLQLLTEEKKYSQKIVVE